MDGIYLRADLRATLEQSAAQQSRSVDELVNEAVEQYLAEQRLAQLNREIEAYKRIHFELREFYLHQWVAVYRGKLFDHDPDRPALYQRVHAALGDAVVLIRQVSEHADPEIVTRTPSTGRLDS